MKVNKLLGRKKGTTVDSLNRVHQPSSRETTAKLSAVAFALSGVILHFIGSVGHEYYLKAWGIAPGLFPKATDEIIIEGVNVLLERVSALFGLIENSTGFVFLLLSIAVMYIMFLLHLNDYKAGKTLIAMRNKMPSWLAVAASRASLAFVVAAGIPAILVTLAILIGIVGVFGASSGMKRAEDEMIKFQSGCEKVTKNHKCVALQKDGKVVARGLLIDSSPLHVALYDTNTKTARVLDIKGIDFKTESLREEK